MTFAAKLLYVVTALLAILLVSGCETVGTKVKSKPVKPEPAVIQKKVHVGDDVVIGTKDGKEFRLRVTQVTSEAVVGKRTSGEYEEIEVPFEEIETIEIEKIVKARRVDDLKVWEWGAAGVAAIFLFPFLLLGMFGGL